MPLKIKGLVVQILVFTICYLGFSYFTNRDSFQEEWTTYLLYGFIIGLISALASYFVEKRFPTK